ncbi:DEAD/DEAH box helicase family protein [Hymenobacter sp. AT01-02]|uniref:DEAD/DEAH box helicase family protein n=1 Tax=Hymenobacter sp. AT01-02 TaxID=1571877 RepID=UPI0005F13515|nr:DEAD/DEAH box helicase family protein [Hymenobacter sp. AT01-02]
MNEYSSVQHDLDPNPQPISYFELKADLFREKDNSFSDAPVSKYRTVFHKVALDPGTYLSCGTHLRELDLLAADTAVLNFQAGSGKTELLLDCVQRYAASNEYVVFYCAPFLRLLSELSDKLTQRKVTYVDCTKLAKLDTAASPSPQAIVHLMTPDFLLSSGGRKYVRQATKKRDYREELRSYLHTHGCKVIVILDEIHEKTSVFDAERFPHLLEWFGLVHKVFIASATFTHDAVEVVKAVSFLTERRISVFQADRVKGKTQARLHLHICAQNYSERDLHGLAGLDRVIRAASDRQFHLLAAFKNLAKKLIDDKHSPSGQAISERTSKPLLLTGNNKTAFDESRCSIGTTFKTGVNITTSEAVLIVVLPGITGENVDSAKLGAFSDMRSSVIQAFARVRNGGDIHVFMPPFTTYIHNTDFLLDVRCENVLRSLRGETISQVAYRNEQELFDEFTQLHHIRQQKLAAFKRSVDPATANAYDHTVGFSSLYDYTLAEYPSFKDETLDENGQGLGPFILWMALQEQFTNCSLSTLTVEAYTGATVSLPKDSSWTEFLQAEAKRRLAEYHPSSIHDGIETILQVLGENSSGEQITYLLDPRTSGLKTGTLRELYGQTRVITEAVYNVAEALVLSKPLKKGARFNFLVSSAISQPLIVPKTQEDYFTLIQNSLQDLKHEVLNSAKNVGGKLYLPASFTDVLSESVKQVCAKLVDLLQTATTEVALLKSGLVPLPGYSKEDLDYWSVALRLLRQELGLSGVPHSREGRADIFGKQEPHYKLKVTNIASSTEDFRQS